MLLTIDIGLCTMGGMMRTLVAVFGILFLLGHSAFTQPLGINVQSPPYNAACNGITDDSSALNAAVQAANSGNINAVYIPPGCRLGLNTTQITLGTVKLTGTAPMDIGNNAGCCSNNYGQTGSQIWINSLTQPGFVLGSGVQFENIQIFYPKQTETYATGGYPLFCTGNTITSGQSDSVVLHSPSLGIDVTASIPANSSAWQACTQIATAVNGNTTVTNAGGFAAAEGIPALQQVLLSVAVSSASVTASIANGQLPVTAVSSGTIVNNQTLTGSGVALGTYIAAFEQNAVGGAGSYVLGNLSTTAHNASASGQARLTVTSGTGTANGWFVFDTTHPGAIPAGTSISSGGGTTSLTLSANIASPGVSNLDAIVFAKPQSVASESMTLSGAGNNALGAGYAPGDTGYLNGGSWLGFNQSLSGNQGQFKVTSTQLIAASVNAPGSGCVGTSATLTGTSGTGTSLFQVSATVSGGGVTAINSITVAGNYSVNPTSLAAEPVTGDSCVGTKLKLTMGVLALSANNNGLYLLTSGMTASGTPNVFTQASTSGSGTGLTVVPTFSGGVGTQLATAGGGIASLNGPVQVTSATINSSGTGCVGTMATLTGTTGVGTLATFSASVAGGSLTGTPTVTYGGSYTTEPGALLLNNITEAVTGDSCSGAVLNLTLGPAISWNVKTNGMHGITVYLGAPFPSGPGMPVAYPPLFQQANGDQVNRFDFVNGQISNAFDCFDQNSLSSPAGQVHFLGSQAYCANNYFTIEFAPEITKLTDDYFSLGTYGNATFGPTYNLREWTYDMGTFLHVPGNGTASTAPSGYSYVQGFTIQKSFIGAMANVFRVSTGSLQIGGLDATIDGPMTLLEVDPSGGAPDLDFDGHGSYWSFTVPANNTLQTPQPVFYVNAPSGGAVVKSSGPTQFSDGSMYYFNYSAAANSSVSLQVHNQRIDAFPFHHTNPVVYIQFVGGNGGYLLVDGSHPISIGDPGNSNVGVSLGGPTVFAAIIGNTFYNYGTPVAFQASASATLATVHSNASVYSQQGCSVCGPTLNASANVAGDNWDFPNYAYDPLVRVQNTLGSTDAIGVQSVSGYPRIIAVSPNANANLELLAKAASVYIGTTANNSLWGMDASGNVVQSGNFTLPSGGALTIPSPPTGTVSTAACFTSAGKLISDTANCIASSLRFKTRISPLRGELEEIMGLHPLQFYWKPNFSADQSPQIGLIAEEVAKVDPRLVDTDKNREIRSVKYYQMSAVLIGAIQQLKHDNDNLRDRINRLESRQSKFPSTEHPTLNRILRSREAKEKSPG